MVNAKLIYPVAPVLNATRSTILHCASTTNYKTTRATKIKRQKKRWSIPLKKKTLLPYHYCQHKWNSVSCPSGYWSWKKQGLSSSGQLNRYKYCQTRSKTNTDIVTTTSRKTEVHNLTISNQEGYILQSS